MNKITKEILSLIVGVVIIFGALYLLSKQIAVNIHNITGYNTEDIRGAIFIFFIALVVIKYA